MGRGGVLGGVWGGSGWGGVGWGRSGWGEVGWGGGGAVEKKSKSIACVKMSNSSMYLF